MARPVEPTQVVVVTTQSRPDKLVVVVQEEGQGR